jgi:eukaryotic-like serine/threonine-protein kinase
LADIVRSAPERQGTASSLGPGSLVGRFELIKEIGRGGFGVVWEAQDRELGRAVAFKALRAGRPAVAEERLLREAEAAARLTHPNIVTLFDVGRTDDGPYLVLELLRGETLAKRLEQGPVPVREALRIGVEVAKGLAHAHGQGVIHRDVTPGNVFVCDDGQVKLLDLGMAHAFGTRKLDGGTPAYMAPEQVEGAPEDERTDVFALGVLLYRMLDGELPYPGDTRRGWNPPAELEISHAPALGGLVQRMLAPRPTARPRDAGEVLAALTVFARELERSGGTTVAVGRRRRSRARLAALVAIGMILGTALAAVIARQASSRHTPMEAKPSIAVLPFADLSPKHDQEYFADGVAEEILNALAQVDGLRVSGRTSSFSFKGKPSELPAIGRALNVAHVLEGSVRTAGTRVRITAQLVNTSDGFRLWTQTFDRDITDVFAVQEEIARSVVGAMRVRLGSDEEPSTREYRTTNADAHSHYLKGRVLMREGTATSFAAAARAFEQSLALDPRYAVALAWLSASLTNVESISERPADHAKLERADALATQAIAIAPGLADGYQARGFLRLVFQWDWSGAKSDFERAIALAPGDSVNHTRYGDLLATLGRLRDAVSETSRGAEMDPLSAYAWWRLGLYHNASGHYELAREALDRALVVAPGYIFAIRERAFTHLLTGQPALALSVSEAHPREYMRLIGVTLAQHDLGHVDASRRALDALRSDHPAALYQVAQVYAWTGDRDRAFEWLERARAAHDAGARIVKYDPLLRSLRADPRYATLLREMSLPVE